MHIKALTVEGVGRFASAAHIDGFSEGVNVLAAGNEAGKSTLFRAIRACLFARHDSKGQDIRDLGSDDSQLPATVQLTFLHDGRTYVIKKCFLRSPSATLTENGREIARSKQADEAVWDLLGLSPGSGRTLDDGAFGVLWVGQGASSGVPVPGPAASSVLNSAIASEVGALIGGERARQVVEDIGSELRRYLTETDRPKSDGPLHRAIGEVERWQAAETEAQGKLAALEQQFEKLLQLRQRHQQLTDPASVGQLTQELVEAKNSLADAHSSAQEIRRFEAEESSAKRALDGASQRLRQFCDLTERIDSSRQNEAGLMNVLPEQQAHEHEARAALLRTQEQIAGTEKQRVALSAREQQLEKLSGATVRALRKDDLARQLEALERAAKELLQIDAQLAQLSIKQKNVDDVDELERQIATLDAQLSAAAAHLAVDVNAAGVGRVHIGSALAKDTYSAPVVAPTKVTVGDLAVITITPAPNPGHETRQSVDAERALLLRSIGVASSAEARALLSKRRDLDGNRKAVLAELKTLKVTGDPTSVIAKTKSDLAETDAIISVALADAKIQNLPSNKEIEDEKLELGQQRASLEARRANLEGTRERQQESIEKIVATRSGMESKLELVRKSIADDTALCPDAERAARNAAFVADVTTAETAHQTAASVLSAKRQTAPDAAEMERREARCQRLEQALGNRQSDLIELEREIGRLTGQIQTAGGDGVGEDLAAAREQRELAERERTRIEERVAVLKLLRDTVSGCLTEGRERYYEPVRRHLRPFLNDLFPGAELELGDGFAITGIRRDRPETFTRLSDGTQEQIAVLVRLAMASMLAERGHTVPVILDDALVYCDDDRIKRMFDALIRAGKQQQVIVLTCRLRTFAPLGGHTLRVRVSSEGG
ncbi:MAG: AAA family ATPase [Methylovirgula sp.]|nr:AAA family ATPase [Methylovirgula sp.]